MSKVHLELEKMSFKFELYFFFFNKRERNDKILCGEGSGVKNIKINI